MKGLTLLPGSEGAVQEHIRELKKDIRDYFRRQEEADERHIIRDDGIDGYTEFVRLPDPLYTKDDAETYFEQKEVFQCPDSPGGCKGRAFTCWYKITCRQGRMWAYHRVSYDV